MGQEREVNKMNALIKISSITFLLLLCRSLLSGQDAANLSCLEVTITGDVNITWTPPVNSTGFEKYIVYYSSNGSSFSELGQLTDVATTTYSHIGALANDANRYYFIETQYQAGNQNSDTLQTIYLQLNNFNFEEARLFWNVIHDPLPDGTSLNTKIFKEYPLGNWFLTATVTDTTQYTEPVIVCNDSINYRIEIENNSGCKSVSNVKGAWFKILDEPEKPVIDSISINSNENIVIGWEPVGNASAYIIYRFDSGIWTPIDTVYGFNNTFYEDTLSNPCIQNLIYTVATIDTCGSSGPKDENEARKSLRIIDADYNACDESVFLKWNSYRGPDAYKYNIWVSKDGEPFQMLAETGSGDTSYVHLVPEVGSEYTYYVQAGFSSGTSTSCQVQVLSFSYMKPSFVYLANADVLPNDDVELKIHVDTIVNSCSWEIFRENPKDAIITKIETIDKSDQQAFPIIYLDKGVDPNTGPYNYFVKVLDSCGNEVLESNHITTIFLTAVSQNTNLNKLEWNAQEGWDSEVEKYYIYRMFNNNEPNAPTDSVDGNTLEYTDDLSIYSNLSAIPVYWVKALEKEGNSYGYKESARSNRVSVVKESEMYLANAFRPGGYTPEYKPVYRFYNGKYYLFQIFNRWGNMIFESNDPDAGWDGRHEGKFVQNGVYIYKLIYESLDAESTQKTGTVTVIY